MNSTVRPALQITASQTTFPGPNFLRILKSERIKSLSLTSTRVLLLCVLTLLVAAAPLSAMFTKAHGSDTIDRMSAIPVAGFVLIRAVMAVFGVLIGSSEYSTGMSRTTFVVVPTRWPVLAAKAIYGAFVSFTFTYAGGFLGGLIAQPILGDFAHLDMMSWYIQRPIILSAFCVVAFTLIGLGTGELLRNSAGAIVALLSALTIIPSAVHWLSAFEGDFGDFFGQVYKYLPDSAANALLQDGSNTASLHSSLEPWQGALVLAAYVSVILGGACAALRRRDV